MAENNYENITRPYDYYLSRGVGNPLYNPNQSIPNLEVPTETLTNPPTFSSGYNNDNSSLLGSAEKQPVKSDGSMHNIWLDTFIASTNWKPKTVGFYIDGQSGYAEFQNVYISGDVHASTGEIGGFIIGNDYIIDARNSFGLASTVTLGNDVRFWAGTSFSNRNVAPFRVYEDGTGHMGGFNVNLNNLISDLGNIELDQSIDAISVGSLPSGQRVVLDGPTGELRFYNSSNILDGQIRGSSTPGYGLQIINPIAGVGNADITMWCGSNRIFGFSSNGFGDCSMLQPGSVLFPSPPIVSGSGITSDLGSNGSLDTRWRYIYTKYLGDDTMPTSIVITTQIGTAITPVTNIFATNIGTLTYPVNQIVTNTLGAGNVITGTFSNVTKSTFNGSVVACPLPTVKDALNTIRKIPNPTKVGNRGHYGDGLYFDDLTFPEEVLWEIDGVKEIEHTHMIGLLMQAVRELTSKVDALEKELQQK